MVKLMKFTNLIPERHSWVYNSFSFNFEIFSLIDTIGDWPESGRQLQIYAFSLVVRECPIWDGDEYFSLLPKWFPPVVPQVGARIQNWLDLQPQRSVSLGIVGSWLPELLWFEAIGRFNYTFGKQLSSAQIDKAVGMFWYIPVCVLLHPRETSVLGDVCLINRDFYTHRCGLHAPLGLESSFLRSCPGAIWYDKAVSAVPSWPLPPVRWVANVEGGGGMVLVWMCRLSGLTADTVVGEEVGTKEAMSHPGPRLWRPLLAPASVTIDKWGKTLPIPS